MGKNPTFYGVAAVVALLGLFMFIRRRVRWGLLFFKVMIAVGEKWRDQRSLEKIQSLIRSDAG